MSDAPKTGASRVMGKLGQQVGHSIPETPAISQELSVRHFVLTMTRATKAYAVTKGLPERALVFFKTERTGAPVPMARDEAAAHEIAKAIVAKDIRNYPRKKASSFNFEREIVPSWVLIELDPTINWQFPPDHPGATTKEPDRSADGSGKTPMNANLRYVFFEPGGAGGRKVVVREAAPEDHCRFILFAALERETTRQQFNFIVEFFQVVKDGDAGQTIPIIIDPDFPSDGTDGGGG